MAKLNVEQTGCVNGTCIYILRLAGVVLDVSLSLGTDTQKIKCINEPVIVM